MFVFIMSAFCSQRELFANFESVHKIKIRFKCVLLRFKPTTMGVRSKLFTRYTLVDQWLVNSARLMVLKLWCV